MTEPHAFHEYPAKLKQSTLDPGTLYLRSDEFVAVREDREPSRSDLPVLTLTDDEGQSIAVYRRGPSLERTRTPSVWTVPVYTLSGTRIAVPTGRVFVRFRDGVPVSAKLDDVKRAGYRVAKTLSYAPNAAWLDGQDGEVASALGNLGRLEALRDMVNVEPQLLMARATR